MKNSRAILMIGFSLLIGLVAVVLAARWISQQASLATTQVVVASRDIDLGSVLNPSMLQVTTWPSGSIPSGAIADMQSLDGRVVKTSILRGEPILDAKLAPVGTKGGLSAVINEGRRAITVKVNEVIGVAGFALPGNYVDVMVNTQDQADKPISKIVLEKILVLAVAQEASRDETKPKVVNAVTLEVTPEEAEKLDLARSIGNLSLVLRNQIDKDPILSAGMRKADLLKIAEAPPPPAKKEPKAEAKPVKKAVVRKPAAKPAEPQKDHVEIIRGVQKSSVEI
ncbi:MAG: Flp pilus assembly protein CpaB [Burkholderiales bacterium]